MSNQEKPSITQTPTLPKDTRHPPALLTSRSPFNFFVTNELSPLFYNNPSAPNVMPIKKFSFSDQIMNIMTQPDNMISHSKENQDGGLEQYLAEDSSCSPLLFGKKSHQNSGKINEEIQFFNQNGQQNNHQTPIIYGANSGNNPQSQAPPPKKLSVSQSESELSYKTPTFYQGNSINSDEFTFKSPKFANKVNSFQGDTSSNNKKDETINSLVEEPIEKDNTTNVEFIGCNCKKSRCLKLYCECFAAEKTCVKTCNCLDCKNNLENKEYRTKAINSIIVKNPDAFKENKNFIKRGCNCKKSNCRKKYCECFGIGLKCSEVCKCENCKNKENNKKTHKTHLDDKKNKVKLDFESEKLEEEEENLEKKKKKKKI